MFDMFNIYIKKAAEIYGLPRTRQIYEKAIECLPEEKSREMCTRFSEMETKLGEIDRARAIYAHCSQMCDPRITSDFWQTVILTFRYFQLNRQISNNFVMIPVERF